MLPTAMLFIIVLIVGLTGIVFHLRQSRGTSWIGHAQTAYLVVVLIIGLYFIPNSVYHIQGQAILIGFVIVLTSLYFWVKAKSIKILSYLATKNRGFTVVREGTAKIVMQGGQFEKVLIELREYNLDEKSGNIVKEKDKAERIIGIRPFDSTVSPTRSILKYNWRRSIVDENGVVHLLREDNTEEISLTPDTYWCKVDAAEDFERFPINVQLLLTLQVVNPFKALLRTGENPGAWLKIIIARTSAETRNIVSHRTYEQWTSSGESMGNEIMERLQGGGDKGDIGKDILKEEFEEQYGIKFIDIEVYSVDPSDEEMRKLSLELLRANIRAQVMKKDSDAFKDAGKDGQLLRFYEALEKSPSGGNIMMMMPELFQGIRGGGGLTADDIRTIIQEEQAKAENS